MDAKSVRAHRRMIIGIGVAVVALLLLDGLVILTDQPAFCSTCHEMRPYFITWRQSPHRQQSCTDCHVEPTLSGRLTGRHPTGGQMVTHVLGGATFPLKTPPSVPNARCVTCHPRLPAKAAKGFAHTDHARTKCVKCHPETGHNVTVALLKNVGVYPRDGSRPQPAKMSLARGTGAANLQGHPSVGCSDCHDMGLTGCSTCHVAHHRNNANYGSDCVACHTPAAKFTFAHPPASSACKVCHTVPSDHKAVVSRECGTCHEHPGVTWASSHPGRGVTQPCKACHKLPSDHVASMTRACVACHKRAGVSWVASHPGVESKCAVCHTAPAAASHPAGTCPKCHSEVGVSFAFTHPKMKYTHRETKIPCAKCHPNNYASYSCICHK